MEFRTKLEQLAVEEAEKIAAVARRTEATALMTKIDGTLDLVTQKVQAAHLPDQAQLDTLKKVGNAAGKMLTEVKSVVALSADDVNKTSAETNIRNAEQGLVKVSGATGFGATASATKADADAAFRHIKQAIVTSTNVVKQMIVTDGVVATLKKADAAAAEMMQHADTPLSVLAGALAAAPAAAVALTAPDRITASQQLIDNARQALNAAMAAKQSALVTLGQTRLPTTFRIAPGR